MARYLVVAAGIFFLWLALYLAPSAAAKIQNVYRDIGEEQSATVVDTGRSTRTFNAGGRRGGVQEFREYTVTVTLESGRTVTI